MYRSPVSFKASQQKRADAFVDCHIGRAMSTRQELESTQEDVTEELTPESQIDIMDRDDFTEKFEDFMQHSCKKYKRETVRDEEQAAKADAAGGSGSGGDASVKNPEIPQLRGAMSVFLKMTQLALLERVIEYAANSEKPEDAQKLERFRLELEAAMCLQVEISEDKSLSSTLKEVCRIVDEYGVKRNLSPLSNMQIKLERPEGKEGPSRYTGMTITFDRPKDKDDV